ncbi:hypothetical protein WG66_002826, partial [Moniliophthora roreri]
MIGSWINRIAARLRPNNLLSRSEYYSTLSCRTILNHSLTKNTASSEKLTQQCPALSGPGIKRARRICTSYHS